MSEAQDTLRLIVARTLGLMPVLEGAKTHYLADQPEIAPSVPDLAPPLPRAATPGMDRPSAPVPHVQSPESHRSPSGTPSGTTADPETGRWNGAAATPTISTSPPPVPSAAPGLSDRPPPPSDAAPGPAAPKPIATPGDASAPSGDGLQPSAISRPTVPGMPSAAPETSRMTAPRRTAADDVVPSKSPGPLPHGSDASPLPTAAMPATDMGLASFPSTDRPHPSVIARTPVQTTSPATSEVGQVTPPQPITAPQPSIEPLPPGAPGRLPPLSDAAPLAAEATRIADPGPASAAPTDGPVPTAMPRPPGPGIPEAIQGTPPRSFAAPEAVPTPETRPGPDDHSHHTSVAPISSAPVAGRSEAPAATPPSQSTIAAGVVPFVSERPEPDRQDTAAPSLETTARHPSAAPKTEAATDIARQAMSPEPPPFARRETADMVAPRSDQMPSDREAVGPTQPATASADPDRRSTPEPFIATAPRRPQAPLAPSPAATIPGRLDNAALEHRTEAVSFKASPRQRPGMSGVERGDEAIPAAIRQADRRSDRAETVAGDPDAASVPSQPLPSFGVPPGRATADRKPAAAHELPAKPGPGPTLLASHPSSRSTIRAEPAVAGPSGGTVAPSGAAPLLRIRIDRVEIDRTHHDSVGSPGRRAPIFRRS